MALDVRVGDTERRAVDARLQSAVGDGVLTLMEYHERCGAVWAARTRRELDEVVADLPPQHGGPVPASSAPVGPTSPRRSVAVMSGDELTPPFYAGQPLEAYALMGGSKIDLRTADLPAEVRIRAVAVMGEVEVYVPRGVTVRLSGGALMGGRECKVDPPRAGAPVVEIEAYALMGGVEVKHGRGRKADVLLHDAPGSWPPASPPVSYGSVPLQQGPPAVPARPRRLARLRRRVARLVATGALVGGTVLAGIVVAEQATDELAVMGSGVEMVRSGGSTSVAAVMGSVVVVVPDDAQVDTGGLRLMGSLDCAVCERTDQTGPAVTVRAWSVMGSVDVLTQTEYAAERRD